MNQRLKEKHNLRDCLYWNLFALIPIFTALVAIAQQSWVWTIIYIAVFLSQFLIIEYKFFCSHCPHYCNESETTNCMFLRAVPKYFKKNPGPLTLFDKMMTVLGLVIIILFPVYWLVQSPVFLIIYILSWTLLILTMNRYECSRCIYFNCPANSNVKEIERRGP